MDFRGNAAIVTGGGGGIGEAAALRFAKANAKVMVADINGAAAKATAEKISAGGGTAKYFEGDLTSAQVAEDLVAATLREFGGFSSAFNNVGGSIRGSEVPLHEVDLKVFDAELKLNIYPTMYCMRAELPHLLEKGKGTIVNSSSLAGLGGTTTHVSYNVGKHGVVSLTKCAAIAYGRQGIRVNAVCAGPIDTQLVRANFSGDSNWRDILGEASAMGRIGTPEEVANLVVWLCSDESSFVSGVAIPIDGGASAYSIRVTSSLSD